MPQINTTHTRPITAVLLAAGLVISSTTDTATAEQLEPSLKLAQTTQRGSGDGTGETNNRGPRIQKQQPSAGQQNKTAPQDGPRARPDAEMAPPEGCPYRDKDLNLMV